MSSLTDLFNMPSLNPMARMNIMQPRIENNLQQNYFNNNQETFILFVAILLVKLELAVISF